MHTFHPMSPSNKQTNRTLSDWWAASPVPWCLFCVPIASHENPGMKLHQAWAKGQPLSTRKVGSPVFICDKTIASFLYFFYSVKYSYLCKLTMYIVTDVCSSLAGEIPSINLLSAQIWFKRTLKNKQTNKNTSSPTKRHRLAECILKQDPYIYTVYKKPTSDQKTHIDWKWKDAKMFSLQTGSKRKLEYQSSYQTKKSLK